MDHATLVTAAAALGLAVVHVVARRFEEAFHGIPRSRWLSVGGGVSVAYVFVHLLPELTRLQGELNDTGAVAASLPHELWIGALLGLVVFYGLERLVSRPSDTGAGSASAVVGGPGSSGLGWLHIGSYAVYNGIAGYVLLEQQEAGATSLALYAAAIAVHFVVNDHALVEDHGELYRSRGRWLVAAAVVGGWLLSLRGSVDTTTMALLLAFMAGGIVLNVLKEELPEERRSRFTAFAAAAVGYAALLSAF